MTVRSVCLTNASSVFAFHCACSLTCFCPASPHQSLKCGKHGEVHKARMRSTGRLVVVKQPKIDPHAGTDSVVRLFTHEAAAQVGVTYFNHVHPQHNPPPSPARLRLD